MMRMRVRVLACILLLFTAITAIAQETTLSDTFRKELRAKNEGITSIKCRFVQTREVAVLANVVEKGGTFYFLQQGNILLAFDDGDYIKMTSELFEMKTGGSISRAKVSSNPMLKNLSSVLSACMVGDLEQMTKGFTFGLESTDSEWVVSLVPQRGKAASKISRIEIRFDRRDMSLNVLRMEERSGDYTMYRFEQKQFNVTIDNELFK